MSDALGVKAQTTVFLTAEAVVKLMDAEDIGSFCSAVAQRLDQEYSSRAGAASDFADGLSELGCRFLAEVVTSFYQRRAREG
ncbi:hypothetical protein LOY64_30150 (plasmid) [Pseudomonas corrugata]|uniref:hypothetical protein n=1 Tax=Pseudomonas corrugata TaxID=47879 RepID=UPI00222EB01C|nr:hypothetical protein [Pseudomonas corrugata]UZD98463.1 hypothetical protein LOY64_30245 [Pseudomonas corrugata]UZD98532.1 hypothetical protein LOY64_30150 [Pseudomonas corrugata]